MTFNEFSGCVINPTGKSRYLEGAAHWYTGAVGPYFRVRSKDKFTAQTITKYVLKITQ